MFPSLPRNHEQGELENQWLRRPGKRLRELWPFPSMRDIVTWSLIAFFVLYFFGKFAKAKVNASSMTSPSTWRTSMTKSNRQHRKTPHTRLFISVRLA
ncbi:hypothetical protein [Rubripirellula obstinata]|uniref:hypothetical protein n=1 Tax=Rubripirellula obstinata TaxID=406547 RepID=UPI00082E8DD2|nr:hypothetical protein [Rubripirellula obstinata]